MNSSASINSVNSTVAATLSLSNDDFENNPLWKFVKRIEKLSGGGGNMIREYNFFS